VRDVSPYHGAADLAARLRALPGARVDVAGRAPRGGEILSVTLGSGPRATAILAGLHPIEWIGVEVALALLTRLAASPLSRRVIALPLITIDAYSTVELDLRAGRRRWHRRNPAGVDLNRNFPQHWRPRAWNGRTAADQPEIAAVLQTLRLQGVDRAISLHSIGRKLLLPWGGRLRRPRAWPDLLAAARSIQSRLPERYTISQISRWLPGARAFGAELDWLHADLGALAILVECTMGGFSLRDPSTWLDPFRWYNPRDPALHADAIAAALEPFVRGDPVG
jgi:hypothetical protein